ncbi:MAG: NADH-quinone oxidoreductase subunit C [Deltaproteobacteria bacterium]|nr:NADH-quinone oxidoreductase subunit C [Deltaproteobacteria bacterium]
MKKQAELVLIDRIKSKFPKAVVDTIVDRGEVTHVIEASEIVEACKFVKSDEELQMVYLSDVCGVDYHPRKPRFEVVYHMLSLKKNLRLRLKVRLAEGESVDSVTGVWRSANWYERETFDMFGIEFEGHPDLRRIYLAEDWEGHPLRKDYPLKGFKDDLNPNGIEE